MGCVEGIVVEGTWGVGRVGWGWSQGNKVRQQRKARLRKVVDMNLFAHFVCVVVSEFSGEGPEMET